MIASKSKMGLLLSGLGGASRMSALGVGEFSSVAGSAVSVIMSMSCVASFRSWYSDGGGRSSSIFIRTGVGGATELK